MPSASFYQEPQAVSPFRPGALVIATLANPREKFWGAILGLDPAGLSLCGIELSSFEECTNMMVAGDSFTAATLFFPMHRVERIELDLPEGDIPSLSQRFAARTGKDPASLLTLPGPPVQPIARARGGGA